MVEEKTSSGSAEWRTNRGLVAAAMAGVSLSAVHPASTGVMMAPLEQEFGWSRTQIYSGTSLASLVTAFAATGAGICIDRVGARRVAIVATALLCGAIAMMSTVAGSLWQWWFQWVLVGLAGAAMPTVWLAPIAARFTASRGLAVAVALSGTGISTFLVPVTANALMEAYGWRVGYIGIAAIWAILVLPLILLFFYGAEHGARGKSGKSGPAPSQPLRGLTARQGFVSPTYYILMAAAFGTTVGGVALVLNLVPVLVSTGIDRNAAVWIAGLIGISTIIGRIFSGWLMDRVDAKYVASAAAGTAVILPITLLCFPGSATMAAAGVFTYGLIGGAKIGAIAYLASRHLGTRAFGTLYGAISATQALAVSAAPLAANFVYDMTLSYQPVMWAALPVFVASAMLYLALPAYPEFPEAADAPA